MQETGSENLTVADGQGPSSSPSHGLRCRACGHRPLEFRPPHVWCGGCGCAVAEWHSDQRRLAWDWEVLGLPESLRAMIIHESEKWDGWADRRAPQETPGGTFQDWLDSNASYRRVARMRPELQDLKGKRVLDIGGTCTQTVTMLRSGIARLDHVEVSGATQHLAAANLDAAGVAWKERVFFHTIPAEHLPFDDGTFDVIFSLATIHHLERPRIWAELSRVLRGGGVAFIMEPRFPRPLLRMVPLWRRLRRADRGSDMPLSITDINTMRAFFAEVDWFPVGVLSLIWLPTLGKLPWLRPLRGRIRRIEFGLVRAGGLSYVLGNRALITARK